MEMEDGIFCEDILVDILSRLPKKSLSRFKCVSKGWCALISNRNRVLPKTTDVGFICKSISRLDDTVQITFFRVDSEGNASPDHSLGLSLDEGCLILDSCHGLLLLQKGWKQRCFYVYNPTTKNSVHLPLSRLFLSTAHARLASDGKNFKVIRIFYGHYISSFYFDIFSSQTGEWREIQLKVSPSSSIYHVPHLAQSVYLKGTIHWIWEDYLLIYHSEDEYCKLIELPMHNKCRYTVKKCIWDSEGFLHLCAGDENGIDIWVFHMEDRNYSHDQQIFDWQMKYSTILTPPMLTMCMEHPKIISYKIFSPRALNDDFGILYLMYGASIFSYNLATGMLKEVCAYPSEDPNGVIWNIYPYSYRLLESP